MGQSADLSTVAKVVSAINAHIETLPLRNTPNMRAIRRQYSSALKQASPDFIPRLARKLCEDADLRWFAYELIRNHKTTFKQLTKAELETLGQGINSWWTVDSFARTLSGPAWLNRQVSDELVLKWARSEDRWWRRASLVSTVALNVRSHGGKGDVSRTFQVCCLLVNDHDDMVAKAMSWALRELVVHDATAVQGFLAEYDQALAARVKREVRNKLLTGLKNPKPKSRSSRLTKTHAQYED